MAISASDVKALRDRTGAGMMDCKKALIENDGDMEAAVDWLRKKGLAAAAKKSGRTASEGLVGLTVSGSEGALVEVNSETDFVARNGQFQSLVSEIAALAPAAKGDVEALATSTMGSTGKSVTDSLQEAVGVIGENMNLRRTSYLSVPQGVVAGYMHSQQAQGLGKIGVLVGLESSGDVDKLGELGKQLAMHVAATNPQSVDVASMDPALIEREKSIFSDQARASGKPENIIEKMVEGRLRKFYEESVLLEQVYVIDTDKRVKDVIAQATKDLGTEVKLSGFVRMAMGEGIEKKEDDLAAEVAKLTA